MSSPELRPIQGMSDLSSPEITLWQSVESLTREIMECYRFEEIRTPILEYTSVFTRSLGDTTDVVQKEMYTFEDRGGRRLSLRPEGTAGVMRYAAALGREAHGKRLYYIGPMFRCERPQAGRRRQFHQIGIEAIGGPSPAADVEAIALQQHLLTKLGLKNVRLEINTRGETEDRIKVAAGLKESLKGHLDELCEECRRRYQTNVLRILDCKESQCQQVVSSLPPITDFMCETARQYFQEVLRLLKRLEIPFFVNPKLVRGLDYYVHTVWEVRHEGLGAQDALSGGGRYRLHFGEAVVEGVGFAIGMERLITALKHDMPQWGTSPKRTGVWLVSQGARAFDENFVFAQALRQRGISCGMDFSGKSMKAQMRAADRSGSLFVIIRGDIEVEKGVALVRNMQTGFQEELGLAETMERLLGKPAEE